MQKITSLKNCVILLYLIEIKLLFCYCFSQENRREGGNRAAHHQPVEAIQQIRKKRFTTTVLYMRIVKVAK